jgi:hypothetical protein
MDEATKLLTDVETSERMGGTPTTGTLAVWRCTGRYRLPYVKIGGRVRYIARDVDDFIQRQRCNAPVSVTRRRSRKRAA